MELYKEIPLIKNIIDAVGCDFNINDYIDNEMLDIYINIHHKKNNNNDNNNFELNNEQIIKYIQFMYFSDMDLNEYQLFSKYINKFNISIVSKLFVDTNIFNNFYEFIKDNQLKDFVIYEKDNVIIYCIDDIVLSRNITKNNINNTLLETFRLFDNENKSKIINYFYENGADLSVCGGILLLNEAKNGNLETLEYLLNKNIFTKEQLEYSLIYCYNLKSIKLLLNYGVDINSKTIKHVDNKLITINALTSTIGNVEIFEYLYENGCSVNGDCLIEACKNGFVNVVKLIINKVNIHYNDNESLIQASKYGRFEIVKILIKNGANVNAQDDEAVLMSIENNNVDVFKYLMNNGANINSQNSRFLLIAATKNSLDLFKYFFSKVDVDDVGEDAYNRSMILLTHSITYNHQALLYLYNKGKGNEKHRNIINRFLLHNNVI